MLSADLQSARHSSPRCVLVADDLSGACDAGVWFARNGFITRVALGCTTAKESDVLVVNTDSRRFTASAAAEQVQMMTANLPLTSTGLVFKKIDSTFRGQIAAECDVLIKATGAPFGVIVPAVPSQGRTVQDGLLSVQDIAGDSTLDLRQVLRQEGADASTVSPRQSGKAQVLAARMMRAGASARYVLCDATNEQELAMAAEALMSIRQRPLWIGASGLASHAARLLRGRTEHTVPQRPPAATGPVVLCIGSNHEVTLAQLERVQQAYGGSAVTTGDRAAGQIGLAGEAASHLVLIIDTGSVNSMALRMLVGEIRGCSPAAILMTGGDTAALFCRAAEARALVLEEEVVSGVPAGCIEGGIFDGVRVATKSGGFGGVDCLLDCIRRLQSNAMTEAR